MPKVLIKGVFMGADVKSKTFNGETKTSLHVDVYQPESEETDKMVQLKTEDLSLMNLFSKEYAMGSVIEVQAAVNAYQNKAYFKLLNVVS